MDFETDSMNSGAQNRQYSISMSQHYPRQTPPHNEEFRQQNKSSSYNQRRRSTPNNMPQFQPQRLESQPRRDVVSRRNRIVNPPVPTQDLPRRSRVTNLPRPIQEFPRTTDYFVGRLTMQMFVLVVSSMIDKSAAHYSRTNPLPTHSNPESVFFSITKPDIPTKDYLTRLVKYTQCNNSAFVVMLIYLDRIGLANKRLLVTPFNMHRLLVTALTLACKMLDDRCFSNVHYAKVGGIPTVREMNRLELQFLKYLCYRLHVRKEEYDCKVSFLESRACTEALTAIQDRSPVSVFQTNNYTSSPPVAHNPAHGRYTTEAYSQNQEQPYTFQMSRMETTHQPFRQVSTNRTVPIESQVTRDTRGITGRRSTFPSSTNTDQSFIGINNSHTMVPDASHRISNFRETGNNVAADGSFSWYGQPRYKRQGRSQGSGMS